MNTENWTPDQPIVSIKDVHKSFGDLEVLKGVSLDIMKGEVICIIGPSGSGKSTLIRCVNALNDIQSGSIQVEGQEVQVGDQAVGLKAVAGNDPVVADLLQVCEVPS